MKKIPLFLAAWFTLAASFTLTQVFISGCSSAPPTKLEQKVFDVTTNFTPVLTYRTNIVDLTNVVVVPVWTTNEAYTYAHGANAQAIKGVAGTIGNVAAPGVGGPIASGAVGLLLAAWAWFRGSKQSATANNLAQTIEVARELLKSLPNGAGLDNQLTTWMQNHQAEAGVLPQVLDILDKTVDNPAAKTVSDQLRAALAAIQTPPPPRG